MGKTVAVTLLLLSLLAGSATTAAAAAAQPEADLAIVLNNFGGSTTWYESASFRYEVTNNGPEVVNNVKITITYNGAGPYVGYGFYFDDARINCSDDGHVFRCTLNQLDPAERLVFDLDQLAVPGPDQCKNVKIRQRGAIAGSSDPDPANNKTVRAVTVAGPSASYGC